MGVYLGSSGREIRASCNRWHILAPIIFSLIEVGSYFIIITKDSIKRLECLRGQDGEIDSGILAGGVAQESVNEGD